MRIVKILFSLIFLVGTMKMLYIVFDDQTSRIKRIDGEGDFIVYKSNTTLNPLSLNPIKKTMYSVKIEKNCRINWDVLHFSNENTEGNLKLDFNHELKNCRIDEENLQTLSQKMLKKIGRKWNMSHVAEVTIQNGSEFINTKELFILIGVKASVIPINKNGFKHYKIKR